MSGFKLQDRVAIVAGLAVFLASAICDHIKSEPFVVRAAFPMKRLWEDLCQVILLTGNFTSD